MGWNEIARRRRWHKYESDAARHWDGVWADHWRGKTFESLLADARASVQMPFLARHLAREGAVLESGCGHGQWLAALRRPGLRLVGFDRHAAPMTRGLAADPALTFVQGDIARLPFVSGSLAAVMSFGVLEHFEHGCDAQLAEMLRVLAPDGVLLVSVPYYSVLRRVLEPLRLVREGLRECSALRRILGRAGLPPRRFYQFAYTTREFRRVLARGGFRSQEVIHYENEHGLVRDYAALRTMRRRAPRLFRVLHRALLAISPRVTAHMQMHAAAVARTHTGAAAVPHPQTPHPPRWDRRWPDDVAAIVARRTLDRLPTDELPAAAEVLVTAGFVTDELCALIGLRDVEWSIACERFDRALAALGLTLDRPAAVLVLTLDWARRIVEGSVSPIDGAGEIGGMWRDHPELLPIGCESNWVAFYGNWASYDMSWGDQDERDRLVAKLDAEVREDARKLVAKFGG